ncbi:MAG TPA: ATP-binding cassette domain-containing protein [Acidimicrobiales bacterium]|nr:ATP-binding cassette domain-containing protein [Acidimicrobiales bacterium]
MTPSLSVEGLTKRYGRVVAVDDLTFDVRPGLVTGLVGPNGSGKSTTMRCALGLVEPTAGRVVVDGARYADLPAPLHHVGALLDADAVHGGLSGRDHLRWIAASNRVAARRVDELIEAVGLAGAAGRSTGGYSQGMRQRLGIAAALLADPPILLFDEPMNGLDPGGMVWLRRLLRERAAEGRIVLLSSHLMHELRDVADRLVVIHRGRLRADATVEEVLALDAGGSSLESAYLRLVSEPRP